MYLLIFYKRNLSRIIKNKVSENQSMRLGLPELLIILSILLLLFGAKRLPGLARSLGKSTREFKTGLEEE